MDPIKIMEEARWRCMYGDNFDPDGGNVYIRESWIGNHLLISAIIYLQGTPRYYGRSTAEIAEQAMSA
jgi:hypothetical protein